MRVFAGDFTGDFTDKPEWGTTRPVLEGVVARAAAGERAALAELYDAHAPALRRFARMLTGDTASAEDLVHDVFVALPKALPRYRQEGSLESFLLSIAAHKARNHVRQAIRARAAAAKIKRAPIAHGDSPERALESEQLRNALSRALDALPLKQRLAFVLCDVEGMSSDDAARVLEVPPATVRTRLHHARAELRERLVEVKP